MSGRIDPLALMADALDPAGADPDRSAEWRAAVARLRVGTGNLPEGITVAKVRDGGVWVVVSGRYAGTLAEALAEIGQLPEGACVIEARAPWERRETAGEVPALEPAG